MAVHIILRHIQLNEMCSYLVGVAIWKSRPQLITHFYVVWENKVNRSRALIQKSKFLIT